MHVADKFRAHLTGGGLNGAGLTPNPIWARWCACRAAEGFNQCDTFELGRQNMPQPGIKLEGRTHMKTFFLKTKLCRFASFSPPWGGRGKMAELRKATKLSFLWKRLLLRRVETLVKREVPYIQHHVRHLSWVGFPNLQRPSLAPIWVVGSGSKP